MGTHNKNCTIELDRGYNDAKWLNPTYSEKGVDPRRKTHNRHGQLLFPLLLQRYGRGGIEV
jgi:hypothetical protein